MLEELKKEVFEENLELVEKKISNLYLGKC